MEIVILPTEQQCGVVAADVITDAIAAGGTTLGLATGSSPLSVYSELIRRHRDDGYSFAALQAFLLDEYVGLPAAHPESYARVIRRELIDHVDIDSDRVYGPDGMSEDICAAAQRYDTDIAARGPIDIQLLGIGVNGHIGFNEPTSALLSRTRVKTLSEQTRTDNARFFDDIEQVPRHVITQGLGTICEAKQLLLIATGSHKAAAIAAAVEGPLSAGCPASVLQLHPHATVVIDDAAAAGLANADFYRYVREHKPDMQRIR